MKDLSRKQQLLDAIGWILFFTLIFSLLAI